MHNFHFQNSFPFLYWRRPETNYVRISACLFSNICFIISNWYISSTNKSNGEKIHCQRQIILIHPKMRGQIWPLLNVGRIKFPMKKFNVNFRRPKPSVPLPPIASEQRKSGWKKGLTLSLNWIELVALIYKQWTLPGGRIEEEARRPRER